jgi:phage terminase large subunit
VVSESFRQRFKAAQQNIFDFCALLNFKPTPQQAVALACVQLESELPPGKRLKRISVKSGQGPGKTTFAAIVGMWRAFRRFRALTIITAPTQRQVRDIYMAEVSRLMSKADPELQRMVKIDAFKMTIAGDAHWGIKAVTSNKPENVQGYHQNNLTFIFDEASGIGRPIWQTVQGTLTNEDSLFMAIGNPNDLDTAFHDCFYASSDMWHTFTWNAEEAPDNIVDKANLRRIEREFGRDSDVYRVRVLGEFPRQDPSAIMSLEDLMRCTKTRMDELARLAFGNGHVQRAIGIDLARYGSDESVIVVRRGCAMLKLEIIVKREPIDVLNRAMLIQHDLGWPDQDCVYVVDAGGMGQGAMGTLYAAKKRVVEFHSNAKAMKSEYKDKITEAWFELRAAVQRAGVHIINDRRMLHQLGNRKYVHKKGVIEIESKDDFKERQGTDESSSPDRADGVVLAFYPFAVVDAKISDSQKSARDLGRRLLGGDGFV